MRSIPRGNHWLGDANIQLVTLNNAQAENQDTALTLIAEDVQPTGVQPTEADNLTLMAIRGSLDIRITAGLLDPSRGIGISVGWGIYMSSLDDDSQPDPFGDDDLSKVDWLYLNSMRGMVVDEFVPTTNWTTDPHFDIYAKARRKMRGKDTIFFTISARATSTLGPSDGDMDIEFRYQLRYLVKL